MNARDTKGKHNGSSANDMPPKRPLTPMGGDHLVSHRHVLSTQSYPKDIEPLRIRWFYAVDVPKWKPFQSKVSKKQPTKYMPFSLRDSRAIESAFQSSSDDSGDVSLANNQTVYVNEDHLFKVNIRERVVTPIYWEGPIYEIRRGTWFTSESGLLKPLDENVATQIEEGYLKVKPFRRPSPAPGMEPYAIKTNETWPLYGPHLGKFVVYTDANVAWILADDFYGKLSATFFQRLTSGNNLGGTRIVRGYSEKQHSRAASSSTNSPLLDEGNKEDEHIASTREADLTANNESILGEQSEADHDKKEDERLESEMKEDYSSIDDPERPIDHLILCVHGIGQKLGERVESVNFVHDVNILRKTMKKVYSTSPDLQALNDSVGQQPSNCRVQVLPVVWRHKITFGLSRDEGEANPGRKSSSTRVTAEKDIGEAESEEEVDEEEYATLRDITIEAVPSIRSIVSDVLLDVLLYYQPRSREQIIRTVSVELNRIYNLFKKQHPAFQGRVTVMGHSLGSSIVFDVLCRQPPDPGKSSIPTERPLPRNLALDFAVENFFAVGSPIGLLQMLKGRNIRARGDIESLVPNSPLSTDLDDPFVSSSSPPVSCPKVRDLYNIFHPTDPISYRIEPLVSKAMVRLRPQALPWTKKGLGQQLGYISGFGQRVATSASSMWSGFTSNLLNRSLGFHDLPRGEKNPHTQFQTAPPASQLPAGSDVETLYTSFLRAQNTVNGPDMAKLKSEEAKVRALNRNGRIDYAIQEGVFDVSLLSSIASHLGYWSEEDVAHFILGQLLSKPGLATKPNTNESKRK